MVTNLVGGGKVKSGHHRRSFVQAILNLKELSIKLSEISGI